MIDQTIFENFEKEVAYQKHMLENLGRWFSLLFVVASIGVVLAYSFYQRIFPLFFFGALLIILGVLGMILFGYGIYKGRANLNQFMDYMETKLSKK